ncbi:hypothetical protein [Streptomyces sp. NPDC002215]
MSVPTSRARSSKGDNRRLWQAVAFAIAIASIVTAASIKPL